MAEKVKEEHKPISIELEIDGKMQRFVTPKRISGTLLKEAGMISEEITSGIPTIADLDSYYQFVCDVFGNQFTLQQFEEGADSRDIMKTVNACTYFVMGQVTMAAEMLLKDVDLTANEDEKKT
ncbi:phage tail assembly chaperone G [Virgibacillus oceani]